MRSFLHLNSFFIYNIILLFLFCLIVNTNNSIIIIYNIFFCIFHFLIIYLGIYYYRNILYLIYFFYGLGLDLLMLNEIGTFLSVFIILLLFFKLLSRYLIKLNSIQIYFILISLQLIVVTVEFLISYLLFNNIFNLYYYFQIIFLSIIFSYPVFFLFSKVDRIS